MTGSCLENGHVAKSRIDLLSPLLEQQSTRYQHESGTIVSKVLIHRDEGCERLPAPSRMLQNAPAALRSPSLQGGLLVR